MKLYRPHIPLTVRLQVAERHIKKIATEGGYLAVMTAALCIPEKRIRLGWMLNWLFGDGPCHLDHQPALALRKYNPRTKRYTPDANDPDYLLYRDGHAHHIKTNVRGDGAQYPDRVLIKRARKHLRKKRPKVKIRSRGFPKVHRPLNSRGWP
jgi:hypothetical protein